MDDSDEREWGFEKKIPKNQKASVRQKYNRRKKSVSHALTELRLYTEELLAQDGRIYKRDEAEKIIAAIALFRENTGILEEDFELSEEEYESISQLFDSIFNGDTPE